jgi:hypothetical protein
LLLLPIFEQQHCVQGKQSATTDVAGHNRVDSTEETHQSSGLVLTDEASFQALHTKPTSKKLYAYNEMAIATILRHSNAERSGARRPRTCRLVHVDQCSANRAITKESSLDTESIDSRTGAKQPQ